MKVTDYELPDLRAKIGALQSENNLLREDLKNMTAAYYGLLNRIKELSEEKIDNANI
jgi:predicted nuclease with TOPRIM domain